MYDTIKKRLGWIIILIIILLLFAVHNNLEAQDLPEVYLLNVGDVQYFIHRDTGDTLATLMPMFLLEDITVDIQSDKLHDLKIKKVHSEEYKDHFLRPIQIGIGVLVGYIIINEIHKRQMFKQIKGWQK